MSDRTLLGPADLDDDALAAVVARSLGVADVTEVQVLSCDVEVAEYDIEALTTAGRYWVRGTAQHATGRSPYVLFVKVVQSWTRTRYFEMVPEKLRQVAAAGLPWRNEPDVYRSDLGDRLPQGLSMPEAFSVVDLDEESAALWLRAVEVDSRPWTPETFNRAAYLLGRLAASPQVRPLNLLGSQEVVHRYGHGRVEHQIVPTLRSEDLWQHPLVAEAFDSELRTRILDAVDALPDILTELDGAPLGTAHGDASPRNLLIEQRNPNAFVLIDFGFWSQAPLGFDLSQLLLGEVQLGERPAAELPELEKACLEAYVGGLRAEGCEVAFETVRRAHALTMLLFWGLSAVPLEVMFGAPPPPPEVFTQRAHAARFVFDLVDASRPLHTEAK